MGVIRQTTESCIKMLLCVSGTFIYKREKKFEYFYLSSHVTKSIPHSIKSSCFGIDITGTKI